MALDIIGPGFGRTGTNSLKLALEQLGHGPCHHMFEVAERPLSLPWWQAAARDERVDWDEVFADYRSQTDWPGARYWRDLLEHYPRAKVILTVRDPDDWFDSVQATIVPFMEARGSHASDHLNAIAEMAYATVIKGVFDERISNRAHATAVFRDHVEEVVSTVPEERLLVFDLRDGWGPLCRFLGTAVPAAPFPHTNSSKAFEEKWREA